MKFKFQPGDKLRDVVMPYNKREVVGIRYDNDGNGIYDLLEPGLVFGLRLGLSQGYVESVYELEPQTRTYEFSDDQLQALSALFDLVHWDELSTSWYGLLPDQLKDDLGNEVWQ
jgi:hypothetical protein